MNFLQPHKLSNKPNLTLNIWREVVLDLVEDELDVLLRRGGAVRDLAWSVCGASDGDAQPRQEEDDPAVAGGRVEEAHAGRGVVVGQDDVDAGRGADDGLGRGVVHLTDGVREVTRGVDHTFGLE